LPKRGNSSLWKREDRRDFKIDILSIFRILKKKKRERWIKEG